MLKYFLVTIKHGGETYTFYLSIPAEQVIITAGNITDWIRVKTGQYKIEGEVTHTEEPIDERTWHNGEHLCFAVQPTIRQASDPKKKHIQEATTG